jgi:UPF0755 protein
VCIVILIGFIAKIFIPVAIDHQGPVILSIERGQSLISVSNELQREGIVDSPFLFRLIMSLHTSENKIQAGYYLFSDSKNASSTPRFSIFEVARRLSNGESGFNVVKFVVPEGFSTMDIAQKLQNQMGNIDAVEFASSSRKYEGYLFPDTYFIMPFATTSQIIVQMQNNFEEKVLKNPELMAAIQNSGHSFEDVIKMASILEGEVRTESDRRLVSDLLWRRIKIGMPLQVDATFQYINQKTSAQLTYDDLKIDSLYNTYKYKGLPPTPISNPGIDTIMAAATPEPNNFLYFLNDDEGNTYFAKTYAEHLKLKNKYLK